MTSGNVLIYRGHRKCATCRASAQRRYQENQNPGAGRDVPRVPVAPLLAIMDRALTAAERDETHDPRPLGMEKHVERRLRGVQTIDIYRADRIACKLRMHPMEIWPDFDRIEAA